MSATLAFVISMLFHVITRERCWSRRGGRCCAGMVHARSSRGGWLSAFLLQLADACTPPPPPPRLPGAQAGTLLLLLCSFKSLARPERRYGRAVVTAAAFFSALHILNITLQVRTFTLQVQLKRCSACPML